MRFCMDSEIKIYTFSFQIQTHISRDAVPRMPQEAKFLHIFEALKIVWTKAND